MRFLAVCLTIALLAVPALAGPDQASASPAAPASPASVAPSAGGPPPMSLSLGPSPLPPMSEAELKSKASFAIGVQFGASVRTQTTSVDVEQLVKGIREGLANTAKLEPAEARMLISQFVKTQMEAAAKKNLKEGEDFLTENKKKEGVKTTNSGLQYKVVKAGQGKMPKATDTVVVHYRGTLTNGTEFDSSFKRNQPAELALDHVIPGWTEALQLMPVGSKWQIYLPAKLAYGERSPGPIPPNSVLCFEIELVNIKEPAK